MLLALRCRCAYPSMDRRTGVKCSPCYPGTRGCALGNIHVHPRSSISPFIHIPVHPHPLFVHAYSHTYPCFHGAHVAITIDRYEARDTMAAMCGRFAADLDWGKLGLECEAECSPGLPRAIMEPAAPRHNRVACAGSSGNAAPGTCDLVACPRMVIHRPACVSDVQRPHRDRSDETHLVRQRPRHPCAHSHDRVLRTGEGPLTVVFPPGRRRSVVRRRALRMVAWPPDLHDTHPCGDRESRRRARPHAGARGARPPGRLDRSLDSRLIHRAQGRGAVGQHLGDAATARGRAHHRRRPRLIEPALRLADESVAGTNTEAGNA